MFRWIGCVIDLFCELQSGFFAYWRVLAYRGDPADSSGGAPSFRGGGRARFVVSLLLGPALSRSVN